MLKLNETWYIWTSKQFKDMHQFSSKSPIGGAITRKSLWICNFDQGSSALRQQLFCSTKLWSLYQLLPFIYLMIAKKILYLTLMERAVGSTLKTREVTFLYDYNISKNRPKFHPRRHRKTISSVTRGGGLSEDSNVLLRSVVSRKWW